MLEDKTEMTRIRTTALLFAPWVATIGLAACTIDFGQYSANPPVCGDGALDEGEACDDGPAPTANCNADCTLPTCGDGVVREGEDCDDGNEENGDGCTTSCRFGSFFVAQNIGEPNQAFNYRPGVGTIGTGEDERFVVAWPETPAGASARRIMVREFDRSTGEPLGAGMQISTGTQDNACATVATNSDGRAVVTWASLDTSAGQQWETRYAVVEPNGTVGAPQVVEGITTLTFLGCPKIAATSNGDFCLVMQQKPDEVTPPSLHVHCLDKMGAEKLPHPPNLSETHAGGAGRQWGQHAIVGYQDGFIVLYFDSLLTDDGTGNMVYPIIAARLDASGSTVGNLLTVSLAAGDYIGSSFVPATSAADESFLLSYGAVEQNVERYMVERFESYTQQSILEQPASSVAENEFGGRLVGGPGGQYYAVWSSFPAGGGPCELYGRGFSATGVADGAATKLEDSPDIECGEGAEGVTASNGNVMLVWDLKTGTNQLAIQARVFAGLFD